MEGIKDNHPFLMDSEKRSAEKEKRSINDTSSSSSGGFENQVAQSHHFEKRKISNSLPAYALGSRRAAIHVMDQDNKGYVDANDLYRVSTGLGEDLEAKIF